MNSTTRLQRLISRVLTSSIHVNNIIVWIFKKKLQLEVNVRCNSILKQTKITMDKQEEVSGRPSFKGIVLDSKTSKTQAWADRVAGNLFCLA